MWKEARTETQGDTLVLVALCSFVNDRGDDVWPSLETLAAMCRCTVRSVQTAINKLAAAGHIAKLPNAIRYSANKRTNAYVVLWRLFTTNLAEAGEPRIQRADIRLAYADLLAAAEREKAESIRIRCHDDGHDYLVPDVDDESEGDDVEAEIESAPEPLPPDATSNLDALPFGERVGAATYYTAERKSARAAYGEAGVAVVDAEAARWYPGITPEWAARTVSDLQRQAELRRKHQSPVEAMREPRKGQELWDYWLNPTSATGAICGLGINDGTKAALAIAKLQDGIGRAGGVVWRKPFNPAERSAVVKWLDEHEANIDRLAEFFGSEHGAEYVGWRDSFHILALARSRSWAEELLNKAAKVAAEAKPKTGAPLNRSVDFHRAVKSAVHAAFPAAPIVRKLSLPAGYVRN
jgi:hypothetical protein